MKDFGNVIFREDTKAYIIYEGTYTVPSPDDKTVPENIHKETDSLYEEVDQYAKNNLDKVVIEKIYIPTEEDLKKEELKKAKQNRAEAVSKITVEIDGMVFDGDEISQERMSRTVVAAASTGETGDSTTTWVLHDNTIATPTIAQLARALRAAGEAQTKLWTIPYEDSIEDSTENSEAVVS